MMPLLFYIIKRHVCIKYFIFYAIWQKWKTRISLRCRDIHQSSLIKAVNPWKTKKERKNDNILISLLRYHNWYQFSGLIFFIVIRKPGIRGAWGATPCHFCSRVSMTNDDSHHDKWAHSDLFCRRTLRPIYEVCICKDPSTHLKGSIVCLWALSKLREVLFLKVRLAYAYLSEGCCKTLWPFSDNLTGKVS